MTLVEFLVARLDEDSAGARSDRMRAEVKAKRGILDLVTYSSAGIRSVAGPENEAVVQYLAAVYAGHPDYRPEWAV